MKLQLNLLAGAILAALAPLSNGAQSSPSGLGAETAFHSFANIQVKNFQDESLGRITDLGIDLVNGRIVEVLVMTDTSLNVGPRIVAVPPLAFFPDVLNEVYRLNVSIEVFKSAAAIDLKKWSDSGRSDRIAAAYYLFGQDPYFLETGDVASKTDQRPKVPLGYVERSSRILDMPVRNFQNDKFGKVWSLTLDIAKGRINNVIILAPGNFKTKSIVPAEALAFNPERDALLLDDTKAEFRDEPRYLFTEAAFGQKAYSERQSYTGPHTNVPLEQGTSYRDIDRTVLINREIRGAKIDGRNVQVGTINGRVTLRGWVQAEDDKRRIGEIAMASGVPQMVDNQITVGRPPVF